VSERQIQLVVFRVTQKSQMAFNLVIWWILREGKLEMQNERCEKDEQLHFGQGLSQTNAFSYKFQSCFEKD